jgi:hypothetical protein
MALGVNDFQFGAGANVTPYNFTVPTGLGVNAPGEFNSLSSFGMSSPTLGANSGGFNLPAGNAPAAGGLGMNIPTLQLGLGGVSTLANLYSGLKALGLAQDQFDFQKQFAQKNLVNSTTSYNTALTDRATARGAVEGQSAQQVQDYINKNRLSA